MSRAKDNSSKQTRQEFLPHGACVLVQENPSSHYQILLSHCFNPIVDINITAFLQFRRGLCPLVPESIRTARTPWAVLVGCGCLPAIKRTGLLGHLSTPDLAFEVGGPGLAVSCSWAYLARSLAGAFHLELGLGLVDGGQGQLCVFVSVGISRCLETGTFL